MYKFIKNNQKKMLAVFGVLLMIVFIIPPAAKSGRSRARRPVAKLGDTPIYDDQRKQAADEWAFLHNFKTGLPFVNHLMFPQGIPPQYAQFIRPDYQPQMVNFTLKLGTVGRQIDEHPELFLLLQLEAEREGIVVSDDQIRGLIVNEFRSDNFSDERYVAAARGFLLVQALYDRVANSVKLTDPIWQRTLAEEYQKVQLAVAEFSADSFRHSVAAPTTQQVEQQYEKFRHVDPAAAPKPADDPLGFGYQTPTRVKLQYFKIAHDAVIAAVRKAKNAYDFEVEARQYYYNHESEFNRLAPKPKPSTQPTTAASTIPTTVPAVAARPSTQPATEPALAAAEPAPATGPSTRPFAEVQDEIMASLLEEPAKALLQKIQDAIAHRLDSDYRAYHPAGLATSQPSGANNDAAFESKAYLDQVALAIQKEFNVLPEVQQIAELRSALQLATLPGIGQSTTDQGKTFAKYATAEDEVSQFPGAPRPEPAKPLPRYQTSDPLHDLSSNVYLFRLTEYVPAHAPDLSAVASEVAVDVQTAGAYDDANASARKLLSLARKDGLANAARVQSVPFFTTAPFAPNAQALIPEMKLLPESIAEVARRAASLLASASPDSSDHPVSIVDLPLDRKVLVIELFAAIPVAPPSAMFRQQFAKMAENRQMLIYHLTGDYFNFDAVKSRLQYHSDETDKAGL